MEDNDARPVFFMSSLLLNLVLVAVTAENPLHKDRMLQIGAGFSVLFVVVAISGSSADLQNISRNKLLRPSSVTRL